MTALPTCSLRPPTSVKAEALSKADGPSLKQFVAIAAAERIAVPKTAAFFEERRQRPTGKALKAFLSRADDEPPRDDNQLPEGYRPLAAHAQPARKRLATKRAPAPRHAPKKESP